MCATYTKYLFTRNIHSGCISMISINYVSLVVQEKFKIFVGSKVQTSWGNDHSNSGTMLQTKCERPSQEKKDLILWQQDRSSCTRMGLSTSPILLKSWEQKTEENIGCEGMPVTEKELRHIRWEIVIRIKKKFLKNWKLLRSYFI